MICDNCVYIGNCNQFTAIGSDTPDIYVLCDVVNADDTNGIFTGKLGTELLNIFDKFGLNMNNCRFNTVVHNKCLDETGRYVTPSAELIKQCVGNFAEDFAQHKPKVLITIGMTAAKALFDNIRIFSDDRKNLYLYEGVPTVLANHIKSVVNRVDDNPYDDFCNSIKKARDICAGLLNLSDYSYGNVIRDNTSKTVECLTYEDFDNFCKEHIDKYDTVAYDLETNAVEVHSKYHRVVGFSLAASKDVGCYTVMTALDYEMSDEDKVAVANRMRDILTNKRVMVYNCQHEWVATLNWLGIEIPKLDDVFVQVKLMTGSASDKYRGTRGLKEQAVTHLHYDDWSKDLDTYFAYMCNFEKNVDNIKELLSKYYEDAEMDEIMNLVRESADKYNSKGDVVSYGYVPRKLIARYGSLDASVLFEMWDFYTNWMTEESKTLGINLFQGYEYWMEHHYAGYTLEKNGAYWNDEKADEINQWCVDGVKKTHRELIASPLTEAYLKKSFQTKFLVYLKDSKLIDILPMNIKPIRMCKTSVTVEAMDNSAIMILRSMGLTPVTRKNKSGGLVEVNNGHNFKLGLDNISYLAQGYLDANPTLFDTWYKDTINEYLQTERTIEEYKEVFNPNATSTEFREFVSNILVTDYVRFAKFFTLLRQMTEDPAYDVDFYKDFVYRGKINNGVKKWGFDIAEWKTQHPEYYYSDTPDSDLMTLVNKLRLNTEIDNSSKFDLFLKYIVAHGLKFKSYQISKAYKTAMAYKLEALDAPSLNDIYEMYLMNHMDVEDSSTWDDRFKWLYNYKMYKKFTKTISTYIKGNVGRGNSYYVNTEDFENNVDMPKREGLYEGVKEGKSLLMQQNFRINMAATGRWQCGMHNLPAGPGIKSIFTSRYKGGCIAMPDGSQMEIRILAVESGDENLIQAFKDGVDIHRFFASKIFNRPYDEVEKWQRGLAKNAVFGMIYGESEKTFADSYLHGDLSAAQKVFNDMFEGFPKIKTYIDRAHNQYETFRKVTTLTQRYINLDDPKQDHNAILRQSQNFPIQASAEDIAGLILYKLCRWLKDNNMKSKPFCFIHDSIEIDVHPTELLMIYDKMNYLFNVFPMEEFNAPVECDVPFGMSMGEECAVGDWECDEAFNEATFTLSGYLDEMDSLIDNWKNTYKLTEVLDTFDDDVSEEYIPWSNVFLAKKSTLSMMTGTTRYKGKRRVHLIIQ